MSRESRRGSGGSASSSRRSPAARVARITERKAAPEGLARFTIRKSESTGLALSSIPPDIALCSACLRELFDPRTGASATVPQLYRLRSEVHDRRRLPMTGKTPRCPPSLCAHCSASTKTLRPPFPRGAPPARLRAGPLIRTAEGDVATDEPIRCVSDALLSGRSSLSGAGRLSPGGRCHERPCGPTLRERKLREEKPFAVMVENIEAARALARTRRRMKRSSPPLRPRPAGEEIRGPPLSPSVAPGLQYRAFLPYTLCTGCSLRR
jgi:hydrogenase maturation protein HypF